MAWRNDRTFYNRKCDLTGEMFVSLYPTDTPFPVYHPDAWYGDSWNAMDYGLDYDSSKPFLEQWKDLMMRVPRLGIDIVNCQNSNYCNYCGDDKNCYLDIAGEDNEDCYYNLFTKHSKNCTDCTFTYNSTLCYECIQCYNAYACKWSQYLEDCSECAFCYDLKGCKNCLLSINLRNKEYYILNEPHSKEDYEAKLAELNLGNYESLQKVFDIWKKMRIDKGLYRDMVLTNCESCTGNNLKNSKNCTYCFNATNCEDCSYLYDVLDAKDCQDLNYSLYKPEASYELISTLQMKFSAFCMASHYCESCFYCDQVNNSHDLFGCIGLNRHEYCILNKQYSQEEYESLISQITQSMTTDRTLGEFFPITLSPHGYNETVAQEYMPLSKAEVEKCGWTWTPEKEEPTSPSEALTCEETGKPFKLIPQEKSFYTSQGIPHPHRCPDQRHRDRINLRNPRLLWKRTCNDCSKDIHTSYAEGRPEKVVCEECYLKEVY